MIRWLGVSSHLIRRDCGMSRSYREWSPDQAYIFPPSPRDWLPEDDLVYFLMETVATLDLTPIYMHLRARIARSAAISYEDDGCAAAVLPRHGYSFVAKNHASLPHRCRLPDHRW